MVANVITYRAKSVLRDVAKTFGFTQAQVDGLSKYVDTRDPGQIRLDSPLPEGMTAEMIYDICWRLDGYPRHLGIHSGGMVIADRPLWQVVPLEWGRLEGRTVLQWDKDDSAAVGIVKFDLLGLGMLNADPGFENHPTVINCFSDLMVEVFGDKGRHARSAVGLGSLPFQIAVEIEMIVEVE